MAWEKLGSTKLTSTADTMTVDGFTAKKHLMVQFHGIPSGGTLNCNFTFNNDTGSNYARRKNSNGGSDGAEVNSSNVWLNGQTRENTVFSVLYIVNISSQEKLVIGELLDANTEGSGNAPDRREIVAKWSNTTNQITRIDVNNTGAGDLAAGSEVTVYGTD